VDNLFVLASYLRLKHEENKISKFLNKVMQNKENKQTPIPKIFEDAFDNELEKENE